MVPPPSGHFNKLGENERLVIYNSILFYFIDSQFKKALIRRTTSRAKKKTHTTVGF